MTEDFDSEAFLGWLDEQDGPVTVSQMEQWPNFPTERMQYVTGVFEDGERAYYKRDLRRAARGRDVID